MYQGSLFVICAPSGTGKTSLVSSLTRNDDNLNVSISHTTRQKRSGEEHGRDYFFVSEDEFKDMKNSGCFLEHANVYGHFYGTSTTETQKKLRQGLDLILEIDWQGARQIIQLMPDAVVIGIIPPSIESLKNRLVSRGKDSQEVIDKRMTEARAEIRRQQELNINYLIVNDDFDKALQQLQTVVEAARLRTCVNKHKYDNLLS